MDLPQLLHHHSHNNRSRYASPPIYPDDDHPNFPIPRNSENPRYHQHQQQFHHQNSRHPPPPPPPQTPPFQPPPPLPQPSPFKNPPANGYNSGQPQFSYANPSHDRSFDDGDRSPRPSPSFVRRNFSPSQHHRLVVGDDRRRVLRQVRSPDYWDQPRASAENNLPAQVRAVDFDSTVSHKFQIGHGKSMSPYKTASRLRLEPESESSRFRVEYGDSFEPKRREEQFRVSGHKGYLRRGDLVSSSGVSVREVEFVPLSSFSVRSSESRPEISDGRYEEESFRIGRRDGVFGNQRRAYDRKVHREGPSASFDRGTTEIGNSGGIHFVSAKREYSGSESGRYGIGGSRGNSYQTNRTPRKQFQKKSALLRIQKPYHRNTGNEKFMYNDYHDNSGSSSFRRRDHYLQTDSEVDEEQREGSPVRLDVSFKSNSLVAKAIATPPHTSFDNDSDLTLWNARDIKEYVSDRDCSNVELSKPIGTVIDVGGSVEVVNSASTSDKETIRTEEKVLPVTDLDDSSLQVSLNVTSQVLKKKDMRKSRMGTNPQKDRDGSAKPSLKVAKKKKVVKKIVKKVLRPRPRMVLNKVRKKHAEPLTSDTCVPPVKDSRNHMGDEMLSYPTSSEVNGLGTSKMLGTQMARELEEHDTNLDSSTYVSTGNYEDGSSAYLESSIQEGIGKGPEDAPNLSHGLHIVSEREKDIAKSCNSNSIFNASHRIGDNLDHVFSETGPFKLHNGTSILESVSYTSKGTIFLKEDNLVREETPKATSSSSPTDNLSSPMELAMDIQSSHREDNTIVSTSETGFMIKQPCTDGGSRIPEIDAKEASADSNVPVGGNKEGTSTIRKKGRVKSQLDFSRETNNNLDSNVLDMSSGNPICEITVSILGSSDDGVQPVRDAYMTSSPYGISESQLIVRNDVDSALCDSTLQCNKRRKVSAFSPISQTMERAVDGSLSCLELQSTSNGVLVQHEADLDTYRSAATNLMSCIAGTSGFHDKKIDEVSSNWVGSLTSTEQKRDDMQVRREEEVEEGEVGVCASTERAAALDETVPWAISSGIQLPDIAGTLSHTSVGESDSLFEKGDFLYSSSYLSPPTECSEATSFDEPMNCESDNVSDVHLSDTKPASQISIDTSLEDRELDKSFVNDGVSDIYAQKSLPQCSKTLPISDTNTDGQKVEANTLLALRDPRNLSKSLKAKEVVEYTGKKNQHGHTTSKAFPGCLPSQPATLKKRVVSTNANARTWHRSSPTSSSTPENDPSARNVSLQNQLPRRDGNFQSTSYVRKGNSLVRNPSLSSAPSKVSGFSPVYRLNSAGLDGSKSSVESEKRVAGNLLSFMPREGIESSDKPSNSLIQSAKSSPSRTVVTSGDIMSSASAKPVLSGCEDSISETVRLLENNDPAKMVEDSLTIEDVESQSQVSISDSQAVLNEGKLTFLNAKKIVYVKRESNQLVATSNSVDLPIVKSDKSRASSSDGYYKKRKNQLIRTSLENQTSQSAILSGVQLTPYAAVTMKFSRRRSPKDVAKTFKRSNNSLVWTCGHPTKNNSGSLTHQKAFPKLFPWKRTSYYKSVMHNWSSFSKSSSSMAIRKLLLSRQRDAVYTRSGNGFSLRKSKILSVGGSSLKWSKSIERHSKKANEAATLAVAAVERKKREQKGATCISSGSKDKNNTLRERIFRIGLFRYKMDPSRRTLQRISDDESLPGAPSSNLHKDAKRHYIPRRLVIGTNEYVRIGNGNQLIRDPKKRTRVLANEKVRWSLHTARLRLANKRKYCQFFTRFGRCNKDNGRCPFLHDPSKIAVCTKFLKGLCNNANCKLTHKVIPERMPDCSYYLQGLCTNQSCPYRHVNVNPKASTCEGFLRGYCADGDECRKKHSYVCPSFEATGTCSERPKCKLHHPKTRVQGKKRKRSRELRNANGRYFGSPDALESRNVVSDKCFAQENSDAFSGGICADYIDIGVSDDDSGENNDLRITQTLFCESDTSDLENLSELIKPIRLMNKNLKDVVD